MAKRISVIIPNYNGAGTIGKCLEAVFASCFDSYEVIVVDDCSDDDSAGIIGTFPCKLVRLGRRSGAARARNEGAEQSSGAVLFFIDADCLVKEDTLEIVDSTITGNGQAVFGGSYTPLPYDGDFFSIFQSIFINYSETRKKMPDYIASHAMVIGRDLFLKHNGFPEVFLPIIEDVEFSHRLRKAGIKMLMNPELLVTHIFNFSLLKSVRNAFRKSYYWTIYSLHNRDLAGDSGTASAGLKFNVISWFSWVLLTALFLVSGKNLYAAPIPIILISDMVINRKLMAAFYKGNGLSFVLSAAFYYIMIYPLPVGAGGFFGAAAYHLKYRVRGF